MISGDFASAATLRGGRAGAICYAERNQQPIEHAYLLYYKPAERPKYIGAFLTHIVGTPRTND